MFVGLHSQRIVELISFMHLQDVFYSRKNFLKPELQHQIHRNFEEEVGICLQQWLCEASVDLYCNEHLLSYHAVLWCSALSCSDRWPTWTSSSQVSPPVILPGLSHGQTGCLSLLCVGNVALSHWYCRWRCVCPGEDQCWLLVGLVEMQWLYEHPVSSKCSTQSSTFIPSSDLLWMPWPGSTEWLSCSALWSLWCCWWHYCCICLCRYLYTLDSAGVQQPDQTLEISLQCEIASSFRFC